MALFTITTFTDKKAVSRTYTDSLGSASDLIAYARTTGFAAIGREGWAKVRVTDAEGNTAHEETITLEVNV